jgi:hypothetical protein
MNKRTLTVAERLFHFDKNGKVICARMVKLKDNFTNQEVEENGN